MARRSTGVATASQVDKVHDIVARIINRTYLPDLIKKTNQHNKLLIGNGTPGLLVTVASLATKMSDIEQAVNKLDQEVSGGLKADVIKLSQDYDATKVAIQEIRDKVAVLDDFSFFLGKKGRYVVIAIAIVCMTLGSIATMAVTNHGTIVKIAKVLTETEAGR